MSTNKTPASPADVVATLQDHLQTALQLEQATLPPYLCALWSIRPKSTSPGAAAATRALMTVISEEMIHLAIACNVLNAIGGSPSLNGSNPDHPLPTYPGPLPGHSSTSNPFVVSLAPLGVKSLNTFLDIEYPRYGSQVRPSDGWATIGEFYAEIMALCRQLSDVDFQKTANGQATDASNPVLDADGYYKGPGSGTIYRVRTVSGAIEALNEIIVQGEGVKNYHRDVPNELAHYFQFQQVLRSIEPGGNWPEYERDVYPMAPDPSTLLAHFPPEAIELNKAFNRSYTSLLDQLHQAFNSAHPDDGLQAAIDTMTTLTQPAQQLMDIPLMAGGGNCGPTFLYDRSLL